VTFTDPASRLLALLNRSETEFKQRFLSAVLFARRELPIRLIQEAIENGTEQQLFAVLDRIGARLSHQFNSSLAASADDTATLLQRRLGVLLDFDQTAAPRMAQNRQRLVSGFSQVQRDASRQALIEGIRRGESPRALARRFRNSIGLTPHQEGAVRNFEDLLRLGDRRALTRALRDRRFDPTVLRSLERKSRLTVDQIKKMTQRYREGFLRHRADVIARTEGLRSVHEGVEDMYTQVIANGDLDAQKLIRTWNTTRDKLVRDSHDSMHGQEQPFGQPFVTGAGILIRFPGDSAAPAAETLQCRCALGTRLIA